MIDDVGMGEWLINLTYLRNKKPDPTFLKLTAYSNWGTFNQRRVITVYNLSKENIKMQLLKANKQVLMANN